MIRSFSGKATARLWAGEFVKAFSAIERAARRKLDMIDSAKTLDDLRALPGNRVEALAGDRKGQHSLRVNNQWRVSFRWTEEGAEDVEIVDYH